MIIPFQTSFEDKGTCFPKHFCDLGFRLQAFVNFELCSGHCYIKCISTLGSSFSSFNNASPKLSIQIHKLWSSDSLSTRTYTRKSRYFFIHPQGSLEPLWTLLFLTSTFFSLFFIFQLLGWPKISLRVFPMLQKTPNELSDQPNTFKCF